MVKDITKKHHEDKELHIDLVQLRSDWYSLKPQLTLRTLNAIGATDSGFAKSTLLYQRVEIRNIELFKDKKFIFSHDLGFI